MYVIIIISIFVLLIAAIFINANATTYVKKQEAERRTELAQSSVLLSTKLRTLLPPV